MQRSRWWPLKQPWHAQKCRCWRSAAGRPTDQPQADHHTYNSPRSLRPTTGTRRVIRGGPVGGESESSPSGSATAKSPGRSTPGPERESRGHLDRGGGISIANDQGPSSDSKGPGGGREEVIGSNPLVSLLLSDASLNAVLHPCLEWLRSADTTLNQFLCRYLDGFVPYQPGGSRLNLVLVVFSVWLVS